MAEHAGHHTGYTSDGLEEDEPNELRVIPLVSFCPKK